MCGIQCTHKIETLILCVLTLLNSKKKMKKKNRAQKCREQKVIEVQKYNLSCSDETYMRLGKAYENALANPEANETCSNRYIKGMPDNCLIHNLTNPDIYKSKAHNSHPKPAYADCGIYFSNL